MSPPSGNSGGGSGSGGSRGPIAPAIATVLLIVGGLIGAAVVVPNFVSRSKTVQPTPATNSQAPRSAQAPPWSAPVYQALSVQAPQVAPPAQAPAPMPCSQRAAAPRLKLSAKCPAGISIAVILHGGSTLLVVAHALRLLSYKPRALATTRK